MKNILDKINRADEIQANLELDKTELGKHEVQLANIKEIPNKLKKLLDIQKKLDKILPQLDKLQVEKKDAINLLKMYVEQDTKFLQEIETQVKQLGLDDSSVPNLKALKIEIDNSKGYINK
jgi:DNA repair exonuclease SbcCD ATPase subunit